MCTARRSTRDYEPSSRGEVRTASNQALPVVGFSTIPLVFRHGTPASLMFEGDLHVTQLNTYISAIAQSHQLVWYQLR